MLQNEEGAVIHERPRTRRCPGLQFARLVPLLIASAATSAALAEPVDRPAVVELYTSQGCSSCPPAENLLRELVQRPDVLAVAFHVDYWDSADWHDRFELPMATPRQRTYRQRLGLKAVGTPQLIIDGRQSVMGADRGAVLEALRHPRSAASLEAQINGGSLAISLSSDANRGRYEVIVVGYLAHAETRIRGGENTGNTLSEFNIVRSWRRIAVADEREHHWVTPVSEFPKDASHVLVLLQRPHQGPIDGALNLTLPPTEP